MKKTFLILLVSALTVWGYVAVRVVLLWVGNTDSGHTPNVAGALPSAKMLSRSHPPLDTTFRDPFQSYLYSQKPAPVVPKLTLGKAFPRVIEPPKAILNGILWGEDPVAILKQDGKTELVKKGAEIWDIKVIRIERHQVIVQKQGRQFNLSY